MSGARHVERAAAPQRFKPYPSYRHSGVDWLGEIPAHWETKRLRYVAPVTDERCHTVTSELPYIGLENIESGTGRLTRSSESTGLEGEEAEGTASLFRPGDVLFGKLRPYLAKVLRPEFEGRCSTELLVLRSKADIQPSVLAYQMLSRDFIGWVDAMTYGTKMPRASSNQVMDIPVALAPAQEQRAIATFLDRETARIDALVARKKQLIGLLQEQRTALINRVVTKGLDPSVPTKDSGVEWLREIPAHWEAFSVGRVINSIEQGWSPVAEDRLAGPHEWAVIKLSAVSKGHFHQWEHKALPIDLRPDERFEVHKGDFLLTRSNTPDLVGDVCVVRDARRGLMLCDLVYRLKLAQEKVMPDFLAYWFLSPSGRHQIEVEARGTSQSMVKVSQRSIQAWTVVLPPVVEQRALAAFLDQETERIDALIAKVREAIERLNEFRIALIAAAVTGKIDVSDEAA